jgi:hypothetical protein
VFFMGKKRNQYTKEYKVEAVRLMIEEGRPISELARELQFWLQSFHICDFIRYLKIIDRVFIDRHSWFSLAKGIAPNTFVL